MALEPLYSIDVACELIPITRDSLVHLLHRYKEMFDTPRYDSLSPGQPRMLTESECLKVREMVIQPGVKHRGIKSVLRTRQAQEADAKRYFTEDFWKKVDPFLVG